MLLYIYEPQQCLSAFQPEAQQSPGSLPTPPEVHPVRAGILGGTFCPAGGTNRDQTGALAALGN